MNVSSIARAFTSPRTEPGRRRESLCEDKAAFWWINGYRAKLVIWTPDEWDRMDTPPSDAQFHPAGVWCALRLD